MESGMATAYLVTTSVSDDYSVFAVFLERADAEEVVDRYNREQNQWGKYGQLVVEEMPLFPRGRRPELLYNRHRATAAFHTRPYEDSGVL